MHPAVPLQDPVVPSEPPTGARERPVFDGPDDNGADTRPVPVIDAPRAADTNRAETPAAATTDRATTGESTTNGTTSALEAAVREALAGRRPPPPAAGETANDPAIANQTATEGTAVSDTVPDGTITEDTATNGGIAGQARAAGDARPGAARLGADEDDAIDVVPELRQIAGLTAGAVMDLVEPTYDFAEGEGVVGFTIRVDEHGRTIVVPGSVSARIDSITLDGPTPIGSGVLDVGTARFIIRPKRERRRATDWLDQHKTIDQPEPVIEVPPDLVAPEPAPKRGRWRRRHEVEHESPGTVTTWEFVEAVRETRTLMAERERYRHPDPAELAVRARCRAPVLRMRPPGHPHFCKVGVVVADQPWLPHFDDIHAIPEAVGEQLQPLLSLPSVPVAADLLVGPLGIVGRPAATMAVARHVLVALYALSTPDLRLHIAAATDHHEAWEWATPLVTDDPVDFGEGFSVVIVDGIENFGLHGYQHQDVIDHDLGVVILAERVEELPSYCGTVLQLDQAGTALLTNHLGKAISGTPVGMNTSTAAAVTADLIASTSGRRSR
jgi:hypothetical protein